MKKIILSFAIFFMCLGITAVTYAEGEAPTQISAEEKARQALEALRISYTQRDSHAFFLNVSERASLNRSDLEWRISRQFKDYSMIDLTITEDQVLPSGKKMLIKAHWQKRMMNDRTGKFETSQGNAQFIFKVAQKAKLLDIKQESPF